MAEAETGKPIDYGDLPERLTKVVQDMTKDHVALFEAGMAIDCALKQVLTNDAIHVIRDVEIVDDLHKALGSITERLGGCVWRKSEAAK